MDEAIDLIIIDVTPAADRRQVLGMLDLTETGISQILAAEKRGEIDMSGLYRARRGGTCVGAAWGQVLPGKTAFCWPAAIPPGEPENTANELQQAVDAYLDAAGVMLTQAALSLQAEIQMRRLGRAGYVHLADLDYLMSMAENFPQQLPRSELEFERYTPILQTRFERVVEKSYVATLDCAALDGARSIKEVLRGYRATGFYRPDWWLLVTLGGTDVGCALLADHPQQMLCELMYMGIVPECRGRGWGLEITRYAQRMVRTENCTGMLLAVDERNWPARRIYHDAGFKSWDRRRILVRETP